MTIQELKDIKAAISNRLNFYLIEMQPGFDDSITGFNDAWGLVTELLDELIEFKRLQKPVVPAPLSS